MNTRHHTRRTVAGLVLAGSLLGAACSSDSKSASTTAATSAPTTAAPTTTVATTAAPTTTVAPSTTAATTPATEPVTTDTALSDPDADTSAAIADAVAKSPAGCDPLDGRACLLPFPSNEYTATDTATDTGLRVHMPDGAAGANASGVPIDLTEWNRNDGFSPNSSLLAYVPGIDVTQSKLPSWKDLQSSLDEDATVVIIDTDTKQRVPLWAELDAKATDPADRSLVIHPAIALTEGHHFVVALRGMKDEDGTVIEPGAVFRAYRDRIASDALDARRPAMEATFDALTDGGIDRAGLYLAWDFTVASERNLSERMLSIRDDALKSLGDAAPAFTVTSVTPATDDNVAEQIVGTYTVPNYLTGDGSPGNRFNYADDANTNANGDDPDSLDALPAQNGTEQVGFVCNISTATQNSTEPAHLVEYGHGLLGSNTEIDAGNVRAFANTDNIVFCATKWAGLSEDDVANAAATLGEISNFPTVADRLQQGVLNQIFLGRLMTRTGGLSSLPAFTRADGSSMLDTSHLDYDGNSQGGIMGVMLAAVSPDIERAVLGVPGINYSLLLPRSVDFAEYEAVFKPAYPNDLDRMIDIDLLQMLWDRGEGGGYAQHVTSNPYEGTKAKTVLLDIAFGDWQVSELSGLVAARTMGVTIQRPILAAGRSDDADLAWGLQSTVYPSTGSGAVIWDSGSDPIPLEAVPPSTGRDPHEDPRSDPDAQSQKASFLFDDTLVDVCGGAPCTADNSG
ncbi:MAG: hypothetical protein JWM34_4929 [Ilumatobacteraceae bacterium]|nr:hypothetical protein [Ilumatobacteraceae bacterium]